MPDLDRRNRFYLGRRHDPASGATLDEPLLNKATDPTTHSV